MEVVVQSPSHSPTSGTMSAPYLSPPSSPRFGEYYLSAPTSPSRISQLYREFDDYLSASSSTTPFEAQDDDGFAFFVNRESDVSSRSAEELFDGGKIKPLKQENDELLPSHETTTTTTTPLAFSAKKKNGSHSNDPLASKTEQRRGRDRDRERESTTATELSSSKSGRRVTRSHSPYRKSHYTWEEEQQQQPRSNEEEPTTLNLSSNSGASISSSSSKSSRRWRLRDFLLFRSASEGRGSSKDPLKKYSIGYKKNEEVKASSFRSIDSSSTHGSRRKGQASAHELHYAMKKAESQDQKKRTFLPYRQGILGRLSGFGL